LAATKNDSGDWEISESDLAAREQRIDDAVQMIEKAHGRAVKAAREDLIHIARSIVKLAESPREFNQQVKRLQDALDAHKAAEAFTRMVESIRNRLTSEV
jgi:thymidine phosphorylase